MKYPLLLCLLLALGCDQSPKTTTTRKVVTRWAPVRVPGTSATRTVVRTVTVAPASTDWLLPFDQWCGLVTSLGVIVSIGFGVWQLYTNSKAYRAQAEAHRAQIMSGLYGRLEKINTVLLERETLAAQLVLPYRPSKDAHHPANAYIDLVKSFFNEMLLYHQAGFVTKVEWDSWEKTLEKFFTQSYVKGYWRYNPENYSSGFHHLLDAIVAKSDAAEPQAFPSAPIA